MLIALLCGFFAPISAYAYSGVTIVMSAPTQANLEFADAFRQELIDSKNTHLKVKTINLQETDRLVVAENSELVIALGVKALEASTKLKLTTPVIGVFTPLPVFNKLLAESKRDVGIFSAIVLDQPFSRQFSLIKAVMPETKKVGILLGPTTIQYTELFKDAAEKKSIDLSLGNVNGEGEIIPKLKSILETTETVLAVPDPEIYSRETAQPILLTSYRHQKPMFAYSKSYVQAGALAAVYSNTAQLAKQAAEIAVKSQQAPGLLPLPQSPKYFSVAVNYQVARALNIRLPSEESIHKRLLELEKTNDEESRD